MMRGAYLSARYESRRENDDFTVEQYLKGETELNPFEDGVEKVEEGLLERVVSQLRLESLLGMGVMDLSNGQTRRARVAKALLGRPEVLFLDEPFAGLDPGSVGGLSALLGGMAKRGEPRILLGLRIQDLVPEWVTHLVYLTANCEIEFLGRKEEALEKYKELGGQKRGVPKLKSGGALKSEGVVDTENVPHEISKWRSVDGYPIYDTDKPEIGEALVEMEGAVISYGSKTVLGNWKQEINGSEQEGLWWNLRRGERWGVFGPNGSGKTTLLSLICSDHPKTYSLPIRLFGRSRSSEPGKPGISIFDIQSRIGHSSPEIHNHIPTSLNIRQVLENAWADTFRGIPKLDFDAEEKINSFLKWFEPDLYPPSAIPGRDPPILLPGQKYNSLLWAEQTLFGGLSFGAQKLLLFLRAIIKEPDIVILDEAFSGMDDQLRNRCLLFLSYGEKKVLSRRTRRKMRGGELVSVKGRLGMRNSRAQKQGMVGFEGLKDSQALVVISHVKEEVPGCVREWICLPDSETGGVARVGRLDGPIEGDEKRWEEIWGVGEGNRGRIGGIEVVEGGGKITE